MINDDASQGTSQAPQIILQGNTLHHCWSTLETYYRRLGEWVVQPMWYL